MRLIATSVLAALALSVSDAGILMRPYLQALTPTSVYVLVESDASAPLSVKYGTTPDCPLSAATESVAPTSAVPPTYVHRIALRNLSPETPYYYRVAGEGAFTEISRFSTGALPGTPFRFVWVADDRSGPEVFDSVIVHAAAAKPLIALLGGDLCPRPAYEAWKTGFFRPDELAFAAVVPWVNAPGNHEKWNGDTQAFTHGPVGSGSEGYFSFDCGDMHVLVLNSELPLGAGTAQFAFAESDLHGTDQAWKIVMLHKPAYCAGGHGEDSVVVAMTSMLFEPAGVAMLLTGHSHFYQHNVVNGIHHMVIGSAGAPLYDPARAWYTQKSVKSYNWAVADVTPSTLSLYVYDEHGAPLDTVLLTK